MSAQLFLDIPIKQVLNLFDKLYNWISTLSSGLSRSKPTQYSLDSGGQICVKNVLMKLVVVAVQVVENVAEALLGKVPAPCDEFEVEHPAVAQITRPGPNC